MTRLGTDEEAVRGYLAAVHGIAWAWADRKHVGQLDGGRREGRWPVLAHEFAEMNVLVPQDGYRAAESRILIAPTKRHRHFGSLRSSQALAQCVLGAIAIYRRLDLLSAVRAECGRPAFFMHDRGWSLEFEHEVDTLKEPRQTSIDMLLSGANRRIAVECKFTETEFGTCSRPRAGYRACGRDKPNVGLPPLLRPGFRPLREPLDRAFGHTDRAGDPLHRHGRTR